MVLFNFFLYCRGFGGFCFVFGLVVFCLVGWFALGVFLLCLFNHIYSYSIKGGRGAGTTPYIMKEAAMDIR